MTNEPTATLRPNMHNLSRWAALALVTMVLLAIHHPAAAQQTQVESEEDVAEDKEGNLGWFVAPQARILAQADRLSHAYGLQAGLVAWDWLHLGVTFHQRSGPVNSEDFETPLSEGTTYKGQSELTLGSEFVYVGLLVAPQIRLPGVELVHLDLPLSVGWGGAGFYLSGDDRKTPDGDRVSVWEDRLFDGEDFAGGFAWDVGARVIWNVTEEDWMRIATGVHYTRVDFDAFARQAPFYDGFSTSVSLVFGAL
ncbi:MAG: hypothetical protein AAFS10_05860 [Myxococcota bacterium]